MIKPRYIGIIFIVCFVFFISADFAYAQWLPGQPLVPCGLNQDYSGSTWVNESLDCTPCSLFVLIRSIIDFILIGIMPPLATLFFIIGGFMIMTAGAKIGSVARGQQIMWTTFMGIVIMLCSWLIVNTLLASLSPGGLFANWWQVQCDVTTSGVPPVGGGPGSGGGSGTGTGGQCQFTGVNLCQGDATASCSASSCNQYLGAINQYQGGAASANLLKAIMVTESSCNISASSGTSFGLMQLQPSTANQYKQYCGIAASVSITNAWLTDPANANASVCLAAEFIRRGLSQGVCGNSSINLAAGYNGGPGACQPSADCQGASCAGGSIKRWECLYDNPQNTTCNTGFNETRGYVRKVLQCTNNPGF